MSDLKFAFPESFFHAREAVVESTTNGFVVTVLLPGRTRLISEEGYETQDLRAWIPARLVYTDWPSARRAVNNYFTADPAGIIGMAKTAFFEREADIAAARVMRGGDGGGGKGER